MTSDSDDQPSSRKRARTDGGGSRDGGRKQRGRPRVDTQDETAADRRRTQIRLAQRAYRQRKETTISSLKRRVSALESTIEEMNQSFLGFNDSLIRSGLLSTRPDLAQELKQTTETFVKLAKVAAAQNNFGDDDENMDGEVEDMPENGVVPSAAAPPAPAQSTEEIGFDAGWATSRPSQGNGVLSRTTPRETIEWNLDSFSGNQPRDVATTRSNEQQTEILPFGLIPGNYQESNNNFQQFHVSVPPSPPPDISHFPILTNNITLSSPQTYSFQETTFSRRLLRATMERAFHLLSTRRYRPHIYDRVFRLSLKHTTHESLVKTFRQALTKGTNEDLENYDHPLITLGGAGTHYPKRDAFGIPVYKPNQWRIKRNDMAQSFVIEDDHGNARDLGIDTAGYEGEWFDPGDVQGYLEERGCHIDPQGSFAEVYIDVPREESGSSSPFAASDHSNGSGYAFDTNVTFVETAPYVPTTTYAGSASGSTSSSSRHNNNNSSSPHSHSSSGHTDCSSSSPVGALDGRKSVDFGPPLDPGAATGVFNPALVPDFDDILSASAAAAAAAAAAAGAITADLGAATAAATTTAATEQGRVSPPPPPPSSSELAATTNMYNGFRFDYPPVAGGFAGQQQLEYYASRQYPHRPAMVKRVITIDIAKFIDELIMRCVCLGRAPGFKKADVDRAFNAAVIAAV